MSDIIRNMSDIFFSSSRKDETICTKAKKLHTAKRRANCFNPNRSLGFVKLLAYAWQTALRTTEGVARYGEAGRKDR